jgi:hypothetical protein
LNSNSDFPSVVEDLVQDIGDGQCLGVLTHHYLPNDLPLEGMNPVSRYPLSYFLALSTLMILFNHQNSEYITLQKPKNG